MESAKEYHLRMANRAMSSWSLAEMMVIQAGREIATSRHAFVGMGLPLLASTFAKFAYKPELVMVTEAGIMDWDPAEAEVDHAPWGVADPILTRHAAYAGDMVDALGCCLMGGRVDLSVLGAAEVDRFGNLNALLLGDPRNPTKQLPGTGGHTDAACLSPRVVAIVPLEGRRFVERVSFRSSPGYLTGPGTRALAGLGPQGPNIVVSTFGVFDYDTPDGGLAGSCEMRLSKVFPGMDVEDIRQLIPWNLIVAKDVEECATPSEAELELVRRLDPGPVYLQPGRY